ncbi:homoserine kinase [Pendulispora brunnea]|uniref:Homoserine kinase n=1 Tax=Pendulispora brunnea TaxID=2905690 RepID=A0ABZ2KF54_9BACT
MATLTRISEDQLRVFLDEYSELGNLVGFAGIPEGSVNSNYRVETSAGAYFLRVYEEQAFEGARNEGITLLHLSAHGVPCEAPLLRNDGERTGHIAGKPAALFAWCAGGMRCQASVSTADTAQVGAALARIHVAGSAMAGRTGRFGPAELRLRLDRIAAAADHPTLAAEAEPLRQALDANEARRRSDLPKGLVHGDLFRDNVLWDEKGTIVTLLDFESACSGAFVFDLAVTVLSWCVGDALSPELARAMVSGYESVRPLTAEEREGLHAEACFASLRFAITRITDFAMRGDEAGPRTIKDYRRFILRYQSLTAMGPDGLSRMLFKN